MAATNQSGDRRVVPRWRSFEEAMGSSELTGSTEGQIATIDGLSYIRRKEDAWKENMELPFALDLVSAANVLGQTPLSLEAATYVLEQGHRSTSIGRNLAMNLLGLEIEQESPAVATQRDMLFNQVRLLKKRRIEEQRNAFVWVDLARTYVLLGHVESAWEALKVGLALAPFDRFVIRSAVRYLLHARKPDEALHLLRRNPRTPHDPWLIASEIAVSSVLKKNPKYAKIGVQILNSKQFRHFHTSELATALGSYEMFDNHNRQANRLFRLAIREPNENALAQVIWAGKRTGFSEIGEGLLEVANASEAQTLDALNNSQWAELIEHALKWTNDEAFSSRPRLLASSVASSLLDLHAEGVKIAREGLSTNPGHPGLINNIAFSLALQGRAEEALTTLNQISKELVTPDDVICLTATIGLAYFRVSNREEGTRYYEIAIDAARRQGNTDLQALAKLYFARELRLIGDSNGLALLKEAHAQAKTSRAPMLTAIADKILKENSD
jgi:tetratricopeptide (TPR) repeat protein